MSNDVVAVNLETRNVRIISANKTRENAEAIVSMAVARRGVEEEFFTIVPSGTYKNGDRWQEKEKGI